MFMEVIRLSQIFVGMTTVAGQRGFIPIWAQKIALLVFAIEIRGGYNVSRVCYNIKIFNKLTGGG